MSSPFVSFDFETGGTTPPHQSGSFFHPPIQCAFVAYDRDHNEIDSLDLKLQFDFRQCTVEALKLAHYTEDKWKDAITVSDALRRIDPFFDNHSVERISKRTGRKYMVTPLIGHNAARFDVLYLEWMFQWGWTGATTYCGKGGLIDTMFVAQTYDIMMGGNAFKSYQLEDVYAGLFGKVFDGAHDALNDARATARIAIELMARLRKGQSNADVG